MAVGTRKYYTVNVVYNDVDYRRPDTGLMAHVSTTQSMQCIVVQTIEDQMQGTRKYYTVNEMHNDIYYRGSDGTRKYRSVNVVYSSIDHRGLDTGQMAHVSTAQSLQCTIVYKVPVYEQHLYG